MSRIPGRVMRGILSKYGKTAYANFPYRWFADQFVVGQMPSSIFDSAHTGLIELLIMARKDLDLTQAQLGTRVGRSQSFISLIERGQRRVDVVEFVALARALEVDPQSMLSELLARTSTTA